MQFLAAIWLCEIVAKGMHTLVFFRCIQSMVAHPTFLELGAGEVGGTAVSWGLRFAFVMVLVVITAMMLHFIIN